MRSSSWPLLFLAAPVLPLALLGVQGCFEGADECLTHCWEHTQVIEDTDDDDLFDDTCQREANNQPFNPPLPNLPDGAVTGRLCLENQSDHVTLKKVIKAIQDETTGSLSLSEKDLYLDFVDDNDPGLSLEARNKCLDFLHTNCDDLIPGGIADCCTFSTAVVLCNDFVLTPAKTALTDMDGGGTDQPVKSGTGTKVITDPETCDYVPDLGGTGGTSGTGGADETGSGASDPWGDLQSLVDCSPQTECTVFRELVENVQNNFGIFYDEEVVLTLTTSPHTGAAITGLGSGEDSKDLADEFGIQNNDIITEVNGVTLDSEEAVSDVMLWLSQGQDYVEFKVERRNTPTLLYKITVTDPPT